MQAFRGRTNLSLTALPSFPQTIRKTAPGTCKAPRNTPPPALRGEASPLNAGAAEPEPPANRFHHRKTSFLGFVRQVFLFVTFNLYILDFLHSKAFL